MTFDDSSEYVIDTSNSYLDLYQVQQLKRLMQKYLLSKFIDIL